jgi:hypothetical protein
MESEDKLEAFLAKVLNANNRHELGEDVLTTLQQWKTDLKQPDLPPDLSKPPTS